MSRLVTNWIDSSFTLPYTLHKSLEHELSDGSILLHIMHQLGHLSEEQFEEIRPRNAKDPNVAITNLALLSKILKKVGVSLRKSDVSNILAEEPGVAAAFVMKIKNMQEATAKGKKYMNLPPAYKEAIKSLRPRGFKRTTDRQTIRNTPSEELFYRDAAPVLYSGTFNQIDTMAQNAQYNIHMYDVEKKNIYEEELEQKAFVEGKQKVHDEIAAFERSQREAHVTGAIKKKQDWLKSRVPQKSRRIRDLQFEMATLKIAELKQQRARERLSADVIRSAYEYEHSLSRLGLAGNEDEDIDPSQIAKKEDGEAFLKRLERQVTDGLPSDSEIGDFMTQLKQRTADKKSARYEKEKRQRRQNAEQTASNAHEEAGSLAASSVVRGKSTMSIMSSTYIPNDDEGDDDDEGDEEEARLAQLLAERELQRATIAVAAEEKVRLFAESYRMVADEMSEERGAAYAAVAVAQQARRDAKHASTVAFCCDIVCELVTSVLDAGDAKGAAVDAAAAALLTGDPLVLSDELACTLAATLGVAASATLTFRAVSRSHVWPPFAAVACSLGRLRVTLPEQQQVRVRTAEETASAVTATEEAAAATSAEDAAAATSAEEACPTQSVVTTIAHVVRKPTFIEHAHRIVGSLLDKCYSSSSSSYSNLLSLSREERLGLFKVPSPLLRTVLMLNQSSRGINDTKFAACQLAHWLGGESSIGLWDSTASIAAALKARPLLEPEGKSKTPALTFQALADIFSFDYIRKGSSPREDEDLGNNPILLAPEVQIPATVIAVLRDMGESATRVLSVKEGLASGKPIAAYPFTPATIAILLGQGLWIRSYVHGQFIAAQIPSPIQTLVLAAPVLGDSPCSYGAAGAATFAHIIDWFARGGGREGVPEELALAEKAIAGEGGKPVDPKAAKAKAKSAPESNAMIASSCIDALVYISPDPTPDGAAGVGAAGLSSLGDGSSSLHSAIAAMSSAQPQGTEEAAASFLAALAAAAPSSAYVLQAGSPAGVPAIVCLTDLSVSEALLSIVCDACQPRLEEEKGGGGQSIASRAAESTTRALSLLQARRSLLGGAERTYLQHALGVNSLPSMHLQILISAQRAIEEFRAMDVQAKGLLVMCAATHISHVERGALLREEVLVRRLKTVHPRWRTLCDGCIAHGSSDADLDVVSVKDLICKLGDLIDARHVEWLQFLHQLEAEGDASLRSLGEKIALLFSLAGEAAMRGLAASTAAVAPLLGLLDEAGYDELPWQHDSVAEAAHNLVLGFRRDDMRTIAFQTKETVELLVGGSASARCFGAISIGDGKWRDFVGAEVATTPNPSLSSSVHRALLLDGLQCSATLISTLRVTAIALRNTMQASTDRLKSSIYTRHSYEHATLRDWSAELLNSTNRRDYLSRCHFGVSNDFRFDSIVAITGSAQRVELSDMAIPFAFACELLSSMPQYLSRLALGGGVLPSTGDVTASVVECIQDLIRNAPVEVPIPSVWRDPQRVERVVSSFHRMSLRAEEVSSDVAAAVFVARFARNMAMHLLCSCVASPPPKEYLNRLYRLAAGVAAAVASEAAAVASEAAAVASEAEAAATAATAVDAQVGAVPTDAATDAAAEVFPACDDAKWSHARRAAPAVALPKASLLVAVKADAILCSGWAGCKGSAAESLITACASICCLVPTGEGISDILSAADVVSLLAADTPLLLSESYEKRLLLEPLSGNDEEGESDAILTHVPALLSGRQAYRAAELSMAVFQADNPSTQSSTLSTLLSDSLGGLLLNADQVDWMLGSTGAGEVLIAGAAYTQYELSAANDDTPLPPAVRDSDAATTAAPVDDPNSNSAVDSVTVDDAVSLPEAIESESVTCAAAAIPSAVDTQTVERFRLIVGSPPLSAPLAQLLAFPEAWPLLTREASVQRSPLRLSL